MFNNVGGEDYDNHEFKQEPPKHEDNYFRR